MRLFLVRHGETVDNVAGLYAGWRDSALTAHGVLQARRLGSHIARNSVPVHHLFSSDLQRAVKTAETVLEAQKQHAKNDGALRLVPLPDIKEKNFGSAEGLKYGTSKSGTGQLPKPKDSESAESMAERVDRFLQQHLLPILASDDKAKGSCVVVSHGIILSVLFRTLCGKLEPGCISTSPEVQRHTSFPTDSVPVLPSWSNTGYLEAVVTPQVPVSVERPWASLKLHVERVNCVDHVAGLRKTRGGIGSAQFDAKQRTVDSFFTAGTKRKRPGGE